MALKKKKSNPAKSFEARWEDYDNETKVLLMPLDNEQYQIALERMRRRLARNDEKFVEGTVGVVEGEKTEHENHCMLLGQFILKDWQGAQDENGNPLKYSELEAGEVLKGDVDFFLFVIKKAAAIADENKQELEEAKGKSSPASSGKGTGAAAAKSEA
ncbi:hypothetical protein PS627_00092 [Pseudomonas fluorescens]|uniref:hypothetical protein n=1 Tax=Pseudomonas fluorescens TaxID=294 RepID=UPI001251E39E|nr:hypothetical protein [Pseudomonas fluorescens]CAG8863156.1 hypothetical protein PS627_00092 [Pseudomonas fluorescens]